ncbi:MAG: Na(+)/H(+) antiporter subunit D [Rhodospirillales bacterium]|jgi:multicomponent Na+:H+ antiporter subunit D|nr:Na(+)/H(+) antiporter subunit D [Rhodospirillales bacterium]MDP6644044.1 Na(+)/H(+) antiporter subunit D [Rhodospirillales bacterium]MDP6842569.1 Na(+)/H(+) antiporter subunit D [Rhodospirillales bacterium]
MTAEFPPGLLMIVGAVLVPMVKGHVRSAYMLALPLLGIWQLVALEPGSFGAMTMFGFELTHVRIDKLSLVFGYIFYLAAALSIIFAWHTDDPVEQASALVYVGAAVGATFAGDLITLFIYWELAALASVFLIWAGRTERAYRAGLRYLLIQITSGVLLAAGAVLRANETGSVGFDHIGLDSPGGTLILIAFGIKCAFPFLHNWLQDSYPEASVTGTVFLSAFTTKLAVYVLARGYAGTEMLIWIGALMTAFPIFYAVIENDLRRVLAYSLNNQLGFMVAGIGIGTTLAVNGAVGHAFAHILYKALLFMSMGAVLYRTGTAKGSELGGLYKTMPLTAGFCIVGSASISAFPLFSGFVTKSMILTAAAEEGYIIPFLVLLFASAGVFHHSGIKIPFFAFFAHDSGKRPREAPFNMLLAMGLTAFLCIAIGVYPQPLYALLPFPVDYTPYTATHVVTTLQLLLFSALAFATLQRTGLYPPELRSTLLDFDFSYRWLAPRAIGWFMDAGGRAWSTLIGDLQAMLRRLITLAFKYHGPEGLLARTQAIGPSATTIIALLLIFLVAVLAS